MWRTHAGQDTPTPFSHPLTFDHSQKWGCITLGLAKSNPMEMNHFGFRVWEETDRRMGSILNGRWDDFRLGFEWNTKCMPLATPRKSTEANPGEPILIRSYFASHKIRVSVAAVLQTSNYIFYSREILLFKTASFSISFAFSKRTKKKEFEIFRYARGMCWRTTTAIVGVMARPFAEVWRNMSHRSNAFMCWKPSHKSRLLHFFLKVLILIDVSNGISISCARNCDTAKVRLDGWREDRDAWGWNRMDGNIRMKETWQIKIVARSLPFFLLLLELPVFYDTDCSLKCIYQTEYGIFTGMNSNIWIWDTNHSRHRELEIITIFECFKPPVASST